MQVQMRGDVTAVGRVVFLLHNSCMLILMLLMNLFSCVAQQSVLIMHTAVSSNKRENCYMQQFVTVLA